MEITCRQLIAFIASYVDGDLDEPARMAFERHLTGCRSCRAYLQSYRETMSLTIAIATDEPLTDVPEELVQAILSRV